MLFRQLNCHLRSDQKMILRILMVLISLASHTAFSGDVIPGERLSDLSIADRGELVLSDGDVEYKPWSYPQQPGKVHVVQYMAATMSASKIQEPFRDKMGTDLPQDNAFLSTTILNLDEAMWGTSGMVVSKLKSSKQAFPYAVMVVDEKGAGLSQWQLEKENSAVIVTDAAGVVRYFKQGSMTEAEIDSTLALIRQYIDKDGAIKTAQP
jgi:YtfJ family uncharacterized protein